MQLRFLKRIITNTKDDFHTHSTHTIIKKIEQFKYYYDSKTSLRPTFHIVFPNSHSLWIPPCACAASSRFATNKNTLKLIHKWTQNQANKTHFRHQRISYIVMLLNNHSLFFICVRNFFSVLARMRRSAAHHFLSPIINLWREGERKEGTLRGHRTSTITTTIPLSLYPKKEEGWENYIHIWSQKLKWVKNCEFSFTYQIYVERWIEKCRKIRLGPYRTRNNINGATREI